MAQTFQPILILCHNTILYHTVHFSECDITAYVDKYSYELEYTYTKKEGQVNKLSMEGATSISADMINGVSWYDIFNKLSNLLDE